MIVEKKDNDFFEKSRKDDLKYINQDDLEGVLTAFTKENIINSLEKQGSFELTYRMNYDNGPSYVNMKIAKVTDSKEYIIIAISDIDLQMQKQKLYEQMLRERIVYSRVSALVGEYICMYAVNPETEYFIECTSSNEFKGYGMAEYGENFFEKTRKKSSKAVYKEDLEMFNEHFTKEEVLKSIKEKGKFELSYRLTFDGKPRKVTLSAVMVKENDGEKLIVGII